MLPTLLLFPPSLSILSPLVSLGVEKEVERKVQRRGTKKKINSTSNWVSHADVRLDANIGGIPIAFFSLGCVVLLWRNVGRVVVVVGGIVLHRASA